MIKTDEKKSIDDMIEYNDTFKYTAESVSPTKEIVKNGPEKFVPSVETANEKNDSVPSELVELIITKDPDTGLSFFVKSPVNWANIFSTGDKRIFNLFGQKCFIPRNKTVAGSNAYFLASDYWQYEETVPNMSFLLAEDLHKGVTFHVGRHPVSEERLIGWANSFQNEVKNLFYSYLKPVNISLKITSQMVEETLLP